MIPDHQGDLSMAKPHQIAHRDWTILAIPTAEGFRPLCIASLADFWSDEKSYPTPEQAIAAGKRFVDAALDQMEVA